MNSTLRMLILLSIAALSQQPSLSAQPCSLCGTTASEWIAGITIDGSSGLLDIPGGVAGGCTDYALIDGYVAVLKKGVSHSFSLTPGFSGAAQSEYWKIWIDLNHDGDFNDPADLVYASGSGSTTTVSGSFFIPLSVTTEPSRLRVAMRRGSSPPDCGNYTNGQVLTYKSAYIDECDISFYDACSREYIKQVNLQAINNATGCGGSGYQDFTSISTTLNAGNAYPVQLTPGFFNAGQHPERWLIWIDFNNDYDFDDPGEQVFDSGPTGSTSVTNGAINIPSNAQTATARMRIKMIPTDVNTVTLDPCDPVPGGFLSPDQYGEAEDYTVNISVTPAQGYCWQLQNSLPQVNDLSDVFFTNSNTGWAVGNDGLDGIILKTSNGGTTWSQSLGGTLLLYAVHFTDNQTGWAVGEGGNVQKTSNGGTTWTSQSSGTVNRLLGVYFSNNQIGWAVGVSGNILKTSNGGTTWTNQLSGTTNNLSGVHFTDNLTGWAVGGNGTILKTSNGGTTWVSQSSGTTNSLSGVHFTDNQTGWVVGQGGTILKTSNGGTTWTSQSSGTTIWLAEVHFPDNQTGWAVGLGGTILKTSNGGATWTSEPSGTSNNLSGVHFTDNQTGWAVGQDGIILKYGKTAAASFTASITDLTVTFTNTSTNATSNLWDFGDGQTSTLANPLHTYAIAGTYNVCLTATGTCGNAQTCQSASVVNSQGYCWYLQNSLTTNHLNDVFFVNSNTGWTVGLNGTVLKTSNGGAFWASQSSGTTNHLYGVHFTDNQTGWAVGLSGTLLKTSNGGASWASQSSGTTNHLYGVHFTDNQTGCAVGGGGTILKTSNGGSNWTSQSSGTTNWLTGVHFTDNQTGWAVGQNGTILRTLNGGTNWTSQSSGTTNWLNGVHFTDNQTGWVVGQGGTILSTSNGGTTWTSQSSGTTNWVYGVHFTDNQTGWAVGSNGTILKYGTSSVANFTAANTDLTVTFTNTTTNATTYLWDFGDGQTSTIANPSHTYSTAGTYNVCLTATGGCGNSQTCQSLSVNIAQCPPSGSPQTGESCGSPIICGGLDNYCNTINNNNVARTFPCCAGWTLNNDEWFGFFAGSTTISIDITPSNCIPGSNGSLGLQAAIYASCPPANPSNDWCANNAIALQCSCTENTFTLNSTSFVIGQAYWFVIDGCSGSVCDYTLNVTEGSTLGFAPDNPGLVTGPSQVCQGSTTNYELPAVNGATLYTWTLVPSNVGTITGNDRAISVAWTAGFSGAASLCVKTSNQCFSNPTQSCITVNVLPKPTATIAGSGVLCTSSGNAVNLPVILTGDPNWTFVYAINGVNQPPITASSSPYNIMAVQPGTYNITGVIDGSGCLGTGIGVVVVTSSSLNLTGIASNVPCSGSPTGSINTTVTGGQGPYQYIWTGPSSIGNIPDPTNIFPGNYTVTVTDVLGCTIAKSFTIQCSWTVTPTGRNHTIIVPDTLKSDVLGGGGLQIGDRIGVFYDSTGTGILKCGGYVVWDGVNTSFAAFGNDANPPARNGFNTGEAFKLKIWRSATNQVFDATACYAPVGWLGGLITNTNAFAEDGISMITCITAGTTHAILLNNGWNLISSYVIPSQPDMVKVFAPIATSVDIVKNCDGDSYIPLLMVNGLGNWNLLEGYPLKANQKDTLLVIGQQAVPEVNPIPLYAGWQCIGYLRDSPQNIATVFSAIQGQVSLVKNNEGKIYSPQFGINTIGNMIPGQGYKVKALSNCTLLYQPNFTGNPVDERAENKEEADMLHFVLDSNLNTGNNATIIFLPSVVDSVIHSGDEIGVFTPSGLLCGTALYQGENLAITVWGDDPSTSGVIEGMQVGEAYNFKVWNSREQEEGTAMATFISEINAYMPDAIEIFANMGLVSGMEELTTFGVQTLQLFPNPASESLNIGIGSKTSGKVALTVFSSDGIRVLDAAEIEYTMGNTIYNLRIPAHLPSGMYWFRFQFENGIVYRQVFLQE